MKKYKVTISILLILIITTTVFLPSLRNDFSNWDDNELVTNNQSIKALSWTNLRTIFTSFYVGTYIPLTVLSYAIEYHFCKLNPACYHTTNLMLHLFNCLLVFWLIYLLTGKGSIAFILALLFGVHPLHVESVAWVTERKDVLYGLFYLASLISYLYYTRMRAARYYWLSFVLFCLSFLAKPMAVTLPIILWLIDYLKVRKFSKDMIVEKVPFFVIALLFGIVAIFGQRFVGLAGPKSLFDFLKNILIANYLLIHYLSKILMPTGLSCVYQYPSKFVSISTPALIFSNLNVLILVFAVIYLRRYTRKIVFGGLFFLITIFPVIQPFAGHATAGDRYTYIPSIGIFYILTEGFAWLYRTRLRSISLVKPLLLLVFIGLISMLSFLTWKQCKVWKNSITLWSSTIHKYPDVAIAYYNRGNVYLANKDYGKAIIDLTEAIKLDSNYVMAYNNRGVAYGRSEDYERAVADFTKVLQIDPGRITAYRNRGIFLGCINEYERAIKDFDRVMERNREDAEVYYYRAFAYAAIKKYDEAWQDIKMAQKLGYQVDSGFVGYLSKILKRHK